MEQGGGPTDRRCRPQSSQGLSVSDLTEYIKGMRQHLASQPHNHITLFSSCQHSTVIQGKIHYPRNRAANFPTNSSQSTGAELPDSSPAAFHLTSLMRNDVATCGSWKQHNAVLATVRLHFD